MERIKDKLIELFQICVYAFAVFGLAMLLAYILVLAIPERSYISMEAIRQLLYYIGGATVGITVCLSDIVLEKVPNKIRIIAFFILLYIMGMTYFNFNAPKGLFSSAGYFISFSIWVVYMSLLVLGSWFVYSLGINNKYNKCLENYKNKLQC